jgi:hypothetical protein
LGTFENLVFLKVIGWIAQYQSSRKSAKHNVAHSTTVQEKW